MELSQIVTLAMSTERAIGELLHGLLPERRLRSNARVVRRKMSCVNNARATHRRDRGLASRRRCRWTRGRVSDYWDEVFTADGLDGHAALDDQSAFIASLGSSRSAVVGTRLPAHVRSLAQPR